MRLPSATQLFLLLGAALLPLVSAESKTSSTSEPVPACTASGGSAAIGGFFDLRPDIAVPPDDEGNSRKRVVTSDYHANGYDYNYNFTLNICAPVVKPVKDVVGVEKALWQNVSAYYTSEDGDTFSIG
jgi:cation-dependent mannose-6-phosphate receptor